MLCFGSCPSPSPEQRWAHHRPWAMLQLGVIQALGWESTAGMTRSRKSFFLEQKGLLMANRWRGWDPRHAVWPISDRVAFAVSFWRRWGSSSAKRMFLRRGSCQRAPALPTTGFHGQHSPAVNIDWRETYTENSVAEKQNWSTFFLSGGSTSLPSSSVSHWASFSPRLLKSTERKENELWIGLCPMVNIPKPKWGNRVVFLCLTTACQYSKCKMESPGAPQRFANRGMGQEKQGPRLPAQQQSSEGPGPALRSFWLFNTCSPEKTIPL